MSALLEIIEATRANHPPDCIFDKNNSWIERRTLEIAKSGIGKENIIDACVIAFKEAEVYCPHEGIDRRVTP